MKVNYQMQAMRMFVRVYPKGTAADFAKYLNRLRSHITKKDLK